MFTTMIDDKLKLFHSPIPIRIKTIECVLVVINKHKLPSIWFPSNNNNNDSTKCPGKANAIFH